MSEVEMNILIVAMLVGAVYKCTADGKVSYSDAPCPNGAQEATLSTPAAPAPDPAAGAVLRKQQKQADMLEKARLKREEREDREAASAAKSAAVQRKKCDQLKLKKRWADEDARRATGQATEPARLRAHRAGEAMALECPR
jgi:hypothetical protein